MKDRVLRIEEAAQMLAVSRRTVYNMNRDGTLPFVRRGRRGVGVLESAIQAAMRREIPWPHSSEKPPAGTPSITS